MNHNVLLPREVAPDQVHEVLRRHLLVDGFELVLDTHASRGSWLVDARDGDQLPRPVHLLRVCAAGVEPARAGRRPGLRDRARRGGGEQAGELRHLHHALRASSSRRSPGCSATRRCRTCSSSRAGRWPSRTRSRPRSTGRAAATRRHGRPAGLGTKVLHLHRRSTAAVRLHALADQHRPGEDRPLPEVRLAADRRARDPVPAGGPPWRGRRAEAAGAGPGRGGVRAAPARHRLLHRRADPGRGRRQPHAAGVPAGHAGAVPRARRAVRARRGADRRRPDRHRRGPTSSSASSRTSSRSARRCRSAGSWPAGASTRCPTTCSACPAGSTRPGAAASPTWSAPAGSWRSSTRRADRPRRRLGGGSSATCVALAAAPDVARTSAAAG